MTRAEMVLGRDDIEPNGVEVNRSTSDYALEFTLDGEKRKKIC